MRRIDEIIWHCTATPAGRSVTVETIRGWHVARGWSDIGYHFVVGLDGTVDPGRPLAHVGAHVKGRNRRSIGIVYVGGLDREGRPEDTRTPAQRRALLRITALMCWRFELPATAVRGHNEFARKACPCFDVADEHEAIAAEIRRLDQDGARAGEPGLS